MLALSIALTLTTAFALPVPPVTVAPAAQDGAAPEGDAVAEGEVGPLDALLEALERWALATRGTSEQALADADARITAAVEALSGDDNALALDEWMSAVVALFEAQRFDDCARLATAGTRQHAESAELFGYVGLANLVLAQEAENGRQMRRHATASLAGLLDARALDEHSAPVALYLHYAFSTLGRFDEALAEFDRVMAESPYADRITPSPRYARGRILLGALRPAEALDELLADDAAAEPNAAGAELLIVRALVLADRDEEAIERARAVHARDGDESSLALLADVLGATGKVEEALALLRDAPITGDEQAGTRKSRACMSYLIGLDGARPDDLRAQLTERLDHHILLAGAGPDGTDLDLGASPLCMGYLAGQVPWGPSSWANDLLFYLCAQDAPGYEPAAASGGAPLSEEQITATMMRDGVRDALVGDGALQRAREGVRVHMVMPDSSCPLTIERLLD